MNHDQAVRPVRTGAAFALLGTVQAILNTAVTITSAAGPDIAADLDLGASGLVWSGAAYTLAFSGLLLLGGRMADLRGRRAAFRVGTAVFAAASLVGALVPGGAWLIAARLAQGAGAAVAAPAAMALVGDVFPGNAARGRAMAAWGGLSGVGAALGMQLGGATATWASWRWAFVTLAVAGFAVAALAGRHLPAGPAPVRGRVDVLGAALVTGGVALLSLGLVAVGTHGWLALAVLLPLGAGLVLLAAFGVAESRAAAPLMPLRFLASGRRVAGLATGMLAPIAGSTAAFLMSLYFQRVLGWSALRSAMGFVPYTLVLIAVSVAGIRVVARLGARRTAALGLATMAVAFLLFARIGADAAYVGAPLAGMLALPLGIGLTAAGAVVAATGDVPPAQAALAGGAFNTTMLMGPTIGMALFASLADAHTGNGPSPEQAATDGYTFAFQAAAALFALAALAAAGLRARRTVGRPRPARV
ncbi:MFS transporter [Embleya sp. NBC_00896]|uniref:MFS transporter n=1 Tax=Embleya sp. NBC_00896 TaxID=2975961 RepID=UPI003863CE30|nr:MFS transporter [Embleya sp. NBC_00896]